VKRATHVLPEREQQQHARSASCPCRPSVETWTQFGHRQTRVVHRNLTDPDPPRAEDVLPGPHATHDVDRSP
jgi:hypothetical protein